MTQNLIKRKLRKFLKITEPSTSIQIRNKLRAGHCFGLGLTFGIMFITGYLEWWQAHYFPILNWDETEESLDKLIMLPNNNTVCCLKLRMIFKSFINYIVSNQFEEYMGEFQIKDARQNNILTPNKFIFETMHDGTPIKIINRDVIAGHLPPLVLQHLINKDYIANSICIIHAKAHAIILGFKDGQWILYDPNFDLTNENKIYQVFDDKIKLLVELYGLTGSSLSIEIGHVQKPLIASPFKNFLVNLSPIKACEMLQDKGLHLICAHTPNQLEALITLAKSEANFPNILAHSLYASDDHHWTGLSNITFYAPHLLQRILQIISKVPEGPKLLAKALSKKNGCDIYGIFDIIDEALTSFPKVCEVISANVDASRRLIRALWISNTTGYSALYCLLLKAPHYFHSILKCVAASKDGAAPFLNLLSQKNPHRKGNTILHELVSMQPPIVLEIINFLLTNANQVQIFELIKQKNAEHNSMLDLFAAHATLYIPQLLSLMLKLVPAIAENKIYEFAKSMLYKVKVLDFYFIKSLPTNFLTQNNFIFESLVRLIGQTHTLAEVRDLITIIENDKIFFATYCLSLSLNKNNKNYCFTWNGKPVTMEWVKIIDKAKMKMLIICFETEEKLTASDCQLLACHPVQNTLFSTYPQKGLYPTHSSDSVASFEARL